MRIRTGSAPFAAERTTSAPDLPPALSIASAAVDRRLPGREGQAFVAEPAERSRAPRRSACCFGLFEMRAQAEVPSARRSDTPEQFGAKRRKRPQLADGATP